MTQRRRSMSKHTADYFIVLSIASWLGVNVLDFLWDLQPLWYTIMSFVLRSGMIAILVYAAIRRADFAKSNRDVESLRLHLRSDGN